jgi:hypothetical protein
VNGGRSSKTIPPDGRAADPAFVAFRERVRAAIRE